MRHQIDPRTTILIEAEARRGLLSHAEMARETGMNVKTVQKRFRLPGTATLDEVRAMVRGANLTPEEALRLVEGRA